MPLAYFSRIKALIKFSLLSKENSLLHRVTYWSQDTQTYARQADLREVVFFPTAEFNSDKSPSLMTEQRFSIVGFGYR
jgi:hypothetical protein